MSFQLTNPNILGFLKLLRQGETSGRPDGWFRVNDGSAIGKLVAPADLLKGHPGKAGNRPAGAYQIKYNTFKAASFLVYGWPDFRPIYQSMCTCAIMSDAFIGNAYKDALNGNFDEAIAKLTGKWKGRPVQWSSLPGGPEEQVSLVMAKGIINQAGGSWA